MSSQEKNPEVVRASGTSCAIHLRRLLRRVSIISESHRSHEKVRSSLVVKMAASRRFGRQFDVSSNSVTPGQLSLSSLPGSIE